MEIKPENDRAFLRNMHAQYYRKRERRERIQQEEAKQGWLFDIVSEARSACMSKEK